MEGTVTLLKKKLDSSFYPVIIPLKPHFLHVAVAGSLYYRTTHDTAILSEVAHMISQVNSDLGDFQPLEVVILSWIHTRKLSFIELTTELQNNISVGTSHNLHLHVSLKLYIHWNTVITCEIITVALILDYLYPLDSLYAVHTCY